MIIIGWHNIIPSFILSSRMFGPRDVMEMDAFYVVSAAPLYIATNDSLLHDLQVTQSFRGNHSPLSIRCMV